jgi:hypothetical protein
MNDHKRTTISVYQCTRTKIKLLAAAEGITMAEAVERAVTQLLDVSESIIPRKDSIHAGTRLPKRKNACSGINQQAT